MPKIAQLLRLLAAIDEGRSSLAALKAKLDPERPPSTRTIRRYLATLAEAGFPWRYDRASGTYGFEAGYSLRRVELSGNELFGLLALKGIATSLGGNIGASMDEMAEKLASVAGPGAQRAAEKPAVRVHLADPQLDGERSVAFELLQKAQREHRSVRFGYVDKTGRRSRRHVDVYGFVVSGGRIYAVAYDRGRGAKRVFALDNVTAPSIAPQRYTLPADFDIEAFAARSVSGIYSGDPVAVRVRYSAVVARAASADRVVRERTLLDLPDGGVEIAYVVADPSEFVRWAMKWGAEAEIIDPPEVRSEAVALARDVLARYAPEPASNLYNGSTS
ncbi:MAG: WYL domain-containing protein [Candidatus Eremiobacteraeota bacterium]|nr:WYL domain-containing protein [Candidatus Eremiobacteraeota bacterium]